MNYYSNFKITFSLPRSTSYPHIFTLLKKFDDEIRKQCPEILELVNINSFISNDFDEYKSSPKSVTLAGSISSPNAAKFATAKQLAHAILAKFKKNHGLVYKMDNPKILLEPKEISNKNTRDFNFEEKDLI